MAKQICIIGPTDSGKTIYIYHMYFKIIMANYLKKIPSFKNVVANNFDDEIKTCLNGGTWIKKTPPEGAKTPHPQLNFKKNTLLPNELCLEIPDVPGELFEAVIKKPGPEYGPVLEAIKRAHGYILLLDLKQLKDPDKRQKHLDFYTMFLENFRRFSGLRNGDQCVCPTLVLLNKSDTIHKKNFKKQFQSEGTLEYICTTYPNFFVDLINTFAPNSLIFSWHSNITKVIKTGDETLPDYDAFFKSDTKQYTASFVELVKKLA